MILQISRILLAAAAFAGPASALIINYTGPNSGLWNAGANWSGGVPPTIGDDVVIGNNTSSIVLGMTFNTSIGGAGFNSLTINAATASTFTLTQSGAGTAMISQTLTLGTTTFGAIYDQSNGTASFTTMNIGSGANGQGLYQLSNLGSLSVGTLNLGGASTTNGGNRLTQTGGTATVTSMLTIGTLNTTGIYNLSGGTLNVNGATGMRLGFGGTGTFNHSGGTVNMGANPIDIGSFSGATGTYNLSGTGQINSRSVNLAGRSNALFVQTGGTHTIGSAGSGFLEIGDSGATKDAIYSLSGGTLQVNGNIQVTGTQTVGGNTARLNVSGGTATATGTLTINAVTGLNGGVTVSGTGQLAVNSLTLGGSGTNLFTQSAGIFSTTAGATITSLTGGSTAFTLNGGTATIGSAFLSVAGTGATSVAVQGGTLSAPQIVLAATGSGTLNFDVSGGGTVSTTNLFLGSSSSGAANNLTQSGGTITVTSAAIGNGASPSTFSLSGTGAFNAAGVAVGTSFNGTANGAIQQSGGTLTTNSLRVGAGAGDSGSYVFSGGTLTGPSGPVADLRVGESGSGSFLQTGGTASASLLSVATFSGSTGNYTLGGTGILNTSQTSLGNIAGVDRVGTFTQTGGTHTVSTLLIAPASSYALSGGTLTLGVGLVRGGLFNMSGGTLNGDFRNDGSFFYSGGTFNGSLLNNTSATFLASFNAGMGIRNNGSIAVNPSITLSVAAAQTLDNAGSLTLAGGSLGGAGAIVNNATISGFGTIGGTGGFTNNALLSGSGGNLIVSNTSTNNGNLSVASGLQLQLNGGSLTNNGTLNLNSGAVTGASILFNAAAGSIVGPGLITTPFTTSGAIGVSSGTLNVSGAWTNNGVVTLGGLTASIAGGALNNPGTIQGFGNLSANVNNLNNGTIEAIGGTLRFASLTNASGALITAGAGGKVVASAGLATSAGTINLSGGTFDNNGFALTNSGQISGFGTFRTGGAGLTNAGSITFTGGNTTVNGNVTNNGGQLLRVLYNPITFTGNVTNNGIFQVTQTTATFAGTFTNNGTFTTNAAFLAESLHFGPTSSASAERGSSFVLTGDLLNASRRGADFQFDLAQVRFTGGAHQMVWNAVDHGATSAGYTGNFVIGTISLDSGASLTLQNTNPRLPGALYVHTLELAGGVAQLSLLQTQGQNIYYDAGALGNAYLASATYDLPGGGQLIPAHGVPEPGTWALLLTGAAAVGALRRRRSGKA